MRVHVAPAFGAREPHPQFDWIEGLYRACGRGRFMLVDRPESADAILLTDVGASPTHVRFRARVLRVLAHPLVRRYRSRCFIYHERDVPRPYLPGLYLNMEWFPDAERMVAAVAPCRGLEPSPNPYMDDTPPPAARDLLFSFIGRNCHPLRGELLAGPRRDDVVLLDTSDLYDHYGPRHEASMQREYVDVMRRSKWALCPRGWSASSLRLFEAMRLGIAPVVLSDNWMKPAGPDWDRCCLWIPEVDVDRVREILDEAGDTWLEMGRAAQRAYRDFFAGGRAFEHIMVTLEGLLPRWKRESMLVHRLRQAGEVAIHVVGLTSPAMSRARRLGRTAISRRAHAGAPGDTGA